VAVWHALLVGGPGEGYLAAGRFGEAGTVAARAVELARAHKERGHEALCLRLLGEIDAASERTAAAEARYGEALTLASQLGMCPLVARCQLGLGLLHKWAGRVAQARGHLTIASDMMRSMHMQFWLSTVSQELCTLAETREGSSSLLVEP
jgi:hypothetical protein